MCVTLTAYVDASLAKLDNTYLQEEHSICFFLGSGLNSQTDDKDVSMGIPPTHEFDRMNSMIQTVFAL